MNIGFILIIVILILVLVTIISSFKIVKQSEVAVVERFGKFKETLQPGIHLITPVFDRISARIDIREIVLNFDPQPVITSDNVTIQIDTVVYIYVTDPERYMYGVANPITALENLSATTLRNIIGDLELDQTLTSRDIINSKIRATLDEATDAWGIKVTRVEVKNIIPPRDIQDAMEKQMRAEREKREKVLTAEGNKIAQITEAEGYKESKILKAEAEKQEQILNAEGEAEAILKVQKAYAEALERLNEAKPSSEVLMLKQYEAFEKMADGKASKLIIPQDMKNITTLAASIKEVVKEDK